MVPLGTERNEMIPLYGLIAAVFAAVFFGIFFWHRAKETTLVLCYTATPSPRRFLRWMRWAKKLHYPILKGEKFPTVPGVQILFLNGYRSFYTQIFPLLTAEKIPATVGLIPAWINKYSGFSQPPWQDMLTQQDIDALAKQPFLSFAAQPLNGEDIAALSAQDAAFCVQESIFRLPRYYNATPLFAVLTSSSRSAGSSDIYSAAGTLPVLWVQQGISSLVNVPPTAGTARVLFPDSHPLRTAYYLWKHRPH